MLRVKIKPGNFNPIPLLSLAFLLVACGPKPAAQPEKIEVDPLRFSEAISAFKQADSLGMPRPNAVLFVGSSSIRGWKSLAEDFPELDVINRGFGGSHMSDLIYFMDDIVFPYSPNALVVYEGDNDIAAGKSPQTVFEDYLTFVSRVREKWAEVPIFFIAIKPSLARADVMEKMASANALVKTHAESQGNLYFIDVFTPMLGPDGQPKPEIFIEDGLHLNEQGYALWTQIVKREMGIE